MKHIRWYDKNPDLKDVFEFIQGLDSAIQNKIANEILQILMHDFGLNLDEKINNIVKNYNYDCNRWYDNNVNLFSSFEIIKSMSSVEKSKVIEKIITSILFVYIEESSNINV